MYRGISGQSFRRAHETLTHKPDHHREQTDEHVAAGTVKSYRSRATPRWLPWTRALQHRDDIESSKSDKYKTQGDTQARFHDEVCLLFKQI